jgi:hypothetical protein
MSTRRGKRSPSAQELRAAVDGVIFESLEQDPDRLARALEAVVERCKAEGRYSADEIDRAAAQLRSEFGLTRKVN